MTSITKLFLKNPLFANVLMFVLIAFGIFGFTKIDKVLFPRISSSEIHISSVYPGASPELMEKEVTRKLESALQGISGLEGTKSVSMDDFSLVQVKLQDSLKEREIVKIMQSIRESISNSSLPKDLPQTPSIQRFHIEDLPIMTIGLSSKTLSYEELLKATKSLQRNIAKLSNIKKVSDSNFRKKQLIISLNSKEMGALQLSMSEVARSLKELYYPLSLGKIPYNQTEVPLLEPPMDTPIQKLLEHPIFANFSGQHTKLSQVGEAKLTYEEPKVIHKIQGVEVIPLDIIKEKRADTLESIYQVKNFLLEASKQDGFQEITYLLADDLSKYILPSYQTLKSNAIYGLLLVLTLLSLFLSFKTSLWVGLGIPISLLCTVGSLYALGHSLDVISMAAMILILGILVDDAIVISEAIHKEYELGATASDAALLALKKVAWPVIGSALTTILAFVPMFFIPGEDGQFLLPIPLVVCFGILFSLLESLVLLPCHIAHSLNKKAVINPTKRYLSLFTDGLLSLVKFCMEKNYLTLSLATALFFLLLFSAYQFLPFHIYPQEGAEEFQVFLKSPKGSSIEETQKLIAKIEEYIANSNIPEIDTYTTKVGTQDESIFDPTHGSLSISLLPFSQRQRLAPEIVEQLRNFIQKNVPEISSLHFAIEGIGPGNSKNIVVHVFGEGEALIHASEEVKNHLHTLPGIRDFHQLGSDSKLGLRLTLDPVQLLKHGLTVSDVAEEIRLLSRGEEMFRYYHKGEEVQSLLRLDRQSRAKLFDLSGLYIQNSYGQSIPIPSVASLKESNSPVEIYHRNAMRSFSFSANYDIDSVSGKSWMDSLMSIKQKFQTSNVDIQWEGIFADKAKSEKSTSSTFLWAMFGIYLLLLVIFKSPFRPLLILSAVPISLTSFLFSFLTHQVPISFPAMLGFIGLCGVSVNGTIILLDEFLRQYQNHPNDKAFAILEAVKLRLRSLSITTLTTFLGLVSLIYGIGGHDPFNSPMALALGWGTLLSNFLIILIFPCILRITPISKKDKHS